MQRTALLSMLFVMACGGGDQNGATVHVSAPTASAASKPPPVVRALGIPKAAPLVASVELSRLAALGGGAGRELEHSLGLPDGALSGNLADLGADPKRPLVLAMAPLARDADAFVDDLRAGRGTDVGATARRLGAIPVVMGVRVLVPASEPRKLEAALRDLATKGGFERDGDGFVNRHRALAISADASWVALDVGLSVAARPSSSAIAPVLGAADEPPPPLRSAAHMTWTPSSFARVGFLSGMIATIGAISGESVSPESKQRIFAEGLKESGAVFTLAEHDGKPIFDRVDADLAMAPFAVTLRAQPGAGFGAPPDSAWAATPWVTVPGTGTELGESRALLDAWQFPPMPLALARDAGWFGLTVGLPAILATAPVELPRVSHEAGPSEDVAKRFERVGEAWTSAGDEIWFGVLPQKTTRDAAQCSLATNPRCAGATKLAVGKVAKMGHGWAKLVQVDQRWILLLAQDPKLLAVTPTTKQAGPLHFETETDKLAAQLGTNIPLPPRLVGDATRDQGAIVFRLVAP